MEHLLSERIKSTPPSFIRSILKTAADPEIISFAGGLPNPVSFPQEELLVSMERIVRDYGSSLFQYSITAIGAMMMQSSLNILGSVAIAGFTAASKIEQLVTQAYVALGTTMATYCAQNMGAGKILRIRQGFKSATWMGFAYAVVTGIFVMFAGKYLTPLFLSENLGQIMGYVDIYLKCVGLFFIPLTVVNVYRNGIQGMGFGILPMMAGVAELIGRGVVAIGAAHYKSYVGVCLASPAAWVLAGGLLLVMYFHIMKRYTEDLSGQK